MDTVLDLYALPWTLVFRLDTWAAYLVISLLVMARIALAGWMLAKAGRSPLWALAALVPFAELAGLWVFAYCRWPACERRQAPTREP